MYKILIIGHGQFPEGLRSSFEMLTGIFNEVIIVSLTKEIDFTEFEKQLKNVLLTNKKWLILSDLFGGSPMQTAAKLMKELSLNDSLLVSGINLSFLLEIYFNVNADLTFLELKKSVNNALEQSKQMMNILDLNKFRKET